MVSSPPIDVYELTRRYAQIKEKSIPFDVDGLPFHLKVKGKQPTVIVNSEKPIRRKCLTLAHELGHVLIPWHVGSIIDETNVFMDGEGIAHQELEIQPNRFASELLMPTKWIVEVIKAIEDPAKAMAYVVKVAETSRPAAAIKLTDCLSPGYIYAQLDSRGVVVSSGRSSGTLANKPQLGVTINPEKIFPVSEKHWESSSANGSYVGGGFLLRSKFRMQAIGDRGVRS
jgi:IrrE N-terminal-like domain